MEYIGGWWIVNDDNLLQIASQLVQVFDVVAPVVDATFSKQARPEHAPLVQQIGHRVRVFGQGRGKQHALVQLAHPFEELVDVRPFQDVHLVRSTVNLHGDDKVRVIDRLYAIRVSPKLSQNGGSVTLKLLCTRVSSRSITIHFFCRSWCRAGGRRNDIRSVATYCDPSTHCSAVWVLSLSLPKQQRSERKKPRVLFFCVCDVVYSAFWESLSFMGRFPV